MRLIPSLQEKIRATWTHFGNEVTVTRGELELALAVLEAARDYCAEKDDDEDDDLQDLLDALDAAGEAVAE